MTSNPIIIIDDDDDISNDDLSLISLMIPQMLASAQLAQND
jgi:hypothetical protein